MATTAAASTWNTLSVLGPRPGQQPTSAYPRGESPIDAIVQDSYGTADTLRLADIDKPSIAANEVLVQVRAAGLHRGTWHLMAGKPYLTRLGFGFRRPRNPVPGEDVAGVVV